MCEEVHYYQGGWPARLSCNFPLPAPRGEKVLKGVKAIEVDFGLLPT